MEVGDVAKRTTTATKLNEEIDELIFVQALTLEETLVMQSEKTFPPELIFQVSRKKKGAVGGALTK